MNFKKMTFLCMQKLTNFPYIEEDFDALTNYELLCKVVEYLNKVIANENAQNEALNELATSFNNLKEYVDNYFENLDVQDEINNKLDEMLEDGVLEQIIEQFLQLTSLICFDNVADMKVSPNLTNGSYAKTLGYYSKNDGGASLYKIRTITNDDVIDEMLIIEIGDSQNQLIAELIYGDSLNLKQLGAKGDNTQDDTLYFKKAVENCKTLYLTNGIFKITANCLINNKVNIDGDNTATLHFTDGTENICPNADGRVNLKNVKVESDSGILYHINRTGIKDTRIENNDLKSNRFCVLVNATSDGGENIIIDNNTIETSSDGIEINTTSDEEDKFKNVFITNNKITVEGGSGTQDGFGIGVADGKNVVISNNIVDNCRMEAIHIEDTSKKIVVTDNVLTNCKNDGMKIYTVTANKERHIIQNNYLSGYNKNNIGINLIYAPTGQSSNYNIGNNTIENFNIGFSCFNSDCDGITVINCNKVVSDDEGRYLKGNINVINTPKFGDFSLRDPLTIESITTPDVIDPSTYITCTNAEKIITINNFNYTIENNIDESGTVDLNLLKCPSYMDVIMEVSFRAVTANFGKAIVHVTYNSTDGLNYTILSEQNNGVFANIGRVILENGMLKLHPYNPNQTTGIETVYVKMRGNIVINGLY